MCREAALHRADQKVSLINGHERSAHGTFESFFFFFSFGRLSFRFFFFWQIKCSKYFCVYFYFMIFFSLVFSSSQHFWQTQTKYISVYGLRVNIFIYMFIVYDVLPIEIAVMSRGSWTEIKHQICFTF